MHLLSFFAGCLATLAVQLALRAASQTTEPSPTPKPPSVRAAPHPARPAADAQLPGHGGSLPGVTSGKGVETLIGATMPFDWCSGLNSSSLRTACATLVAETDRSVAAWLDADVAARGRRPFDSAEAMEGLTRLRMAQEEAIGTPFNQRWCGRPERGGPAAEACLAQSASAWTDFQTYTDGNHRGSGVAVPAATAQRGGRPPGLFSGMFNAAENRDAHHATRVNFGKRPVSFQGVSATFSHVAEMYEKVFEFAHLESAPTFMGVALQQDPSDAFAISDLLWRLRPVSGNNCGCTNARAHEGAPFVRYYQSAAFVALTLGFRGRLPLEGGFLSRIAWLCYLCFAHIRSLWLPRSFLIYLSLSLFLSLPVSINLRLCFYLCLCIASFSHAHANLLHTLGPGHRARDVGRRVRGFLRDGDAGVQSGRAATDYRPCGGRHQRPAPEAVEPPEDRALLPALPPCDGDGRVAQRHGALPAEPAVGSDCARDRGSSRGSGAGPRASDRGLKPLDRGRGREPAPVRPLCKPRVLLHRAGHAPDDAAGGHVRLLQARPARWLLRGGPAARVLHRRSALARLPPEKGDGRGWVLKGSLCYEDWPKYRSTKFDVFRRAIEIAAV